MLRSNCKLCSSLTHYLAIRNFYVFIQILLETKKDEGWHWMNKFRFLGKKAMEKKLQGNWGFVIVPARKKWIWKGCGTASSPISKCKFHLFSIMTISSHFISHRNQFTCCVHSKSKKASKFIRFTNIFWVNAVKGIIVTFKRRC